MGADGMQKKKNFRLGDNDDVPAIQRTLPT